MNRAFMDFNDFMRKASAPREPRADEILGADGIIRCAKCGGARQAWNVVGGNRYLLNIRCACQQAEDAARRAENQAAVRREQIERERRDGLRLPAYRGYTFDRDDRKSPTVTRAARAYVENFAQRRADGRGLLMYGDVGTGKTFMAIAIANALIDAGYKARAVQPHDVIDLDFGAHDFWSNVFSKNVVVIDDMGAMRDTGYAYERLYKLIDGCVARNIPMIITTNYNLADADGIAKYSDNTYQARIWSRILANCMPILVNGISRREEQAEALRRNMRRGLL